MFTLKDIISVLNETDDELKNLEYLLEEFKDTKWEDYIEFSDDKYKRNDIFKNKRYEIILICWKKNQFSRIHNHPKYGCIFKVLKGQLSEFVYNKNLNLIESKNHTINSTGYIDDSLGYHRVGNDLKENAISIHIYSPPDFVAYNF